MAVNRALVDARPEDVYSVLADPRLYRRWVVGARRVRSADPEFPKRGTAFRHSVGFPPLEISDSTIVVESEPARSLTLHARARPLGAARVEIELEPSGERTLVTMREGPASTLARLLLLPPWAQLALWARNAESLRRLGGVVEAERRQGRSGLGSRLPPLGGLVETGLGAFAPTPVRWLGAGFRRLLL